MLQRASKPDVSKRAVEEFKRGADAIPDVAEEKPEMRKVGQWVLKENWERLQRIRLERTMRGEKVTLNTLLDEAIELLWKFHECDGTQI